jgi:RimJ/RimL family protein N-acetyltransferase
METVLTTSRLRLAPLGPADVDAVHALWTDSEVRRYLFDGETISRDETSELLAASAESFARHDYGLWGLRMPAAAEDLAGFCGLRPSDEIPPVELLYALDPRHWRQGLATEAGMAVLRFAFAELGLERVAAATDVPNVASARVLERLGMALDRRGLLNDLPTLFYWTTADRFRTMEP